MIMFSTQVAYTDESILKLRRFCFEKNRTLFLVYFRAVLLLNCCLRTSENARRQSRSDQTRSLTGNKATTADCSHSAVDVTPFSIIAHY